MARSKWPPLDDATGHSDRERSLRPQSEASSLARRRTVTSKERSRSEEWERTREARPNLGLDGPARTILTLPRVPNQLLLGV
eukprot:39156-Pyramimonas_sp.AAC.1